MKKILIIDDDNDICLLLDRYFKKKGFDTRIARDGESGLVQLKKEAADLVLCDFKLPDYTGLEILQKIKILNHKIQVIIITGYSDVRIAVDALKKGAFDYVTKPLYPDEILMTVNNALDQRQESTEKEISVRRASTSKQYLTGKSQYAQVINKHIDLIAPTDMSVIILGETGTGKEYVANEIHKRSKRAGRPFVPVDCGALQKDLAGSELFGHVKGAFTGAVNDKRGCFEEADGGTLFLDEIGNLSYDNQIKLLRVLQEKKIRKVGGNRDIDVDVRVLVATNENLKDIVKRGEFREDIFHRLNEFKIELAPLRERVDDIMFFAMHFLNKANQQLDKNIESFDAEAARILESYYWHGNLRELNNVVKRAVLLCSGDKITAECLPDEIAHPSAENNMTMDFNVEGQLIKDLKSVAEAAEKSAILEILRQTRNNKTITAERLGIDRKTLYNKLKSYQIEV